MRPAYLLILAAAAALATACSQASDRPSQIDSLRVLAVRADHPFAPPGSQPQIEMLIEDGSPAAPRARQVLWMGTCVNPPGDLYYECYPALHAALAGVTDADFAAQTVPAGLPAGAVGFGTQFTASVPADAITSRTPSQGTAYPYGSLFVFFAACAGEIRHAPGANPKTDPPVACYRAGTGEALGPADFEFGYYPIYAYDTLVNQNPIVTSLGFGAPSDGAACTGAAACGSGQTCGSAGRCIPVVAACLSDDSANCPPYALTPAVDPASVERAVSSHVPTNQAPLETIWASYYATSGTFDKDSRVVHDGVSGWAEAYGSVWRPGRTAGEVHLFVVVRDNRGGVTWAMQDVAVR
jgi:hypothetical protein